MDKILIIEDDRFFREMFSNLLTVEGYEVDTACGGAEAFKMLAQKNYGLVITDLMMPEFNGLEILSNIKENDPSIDVIMVTGSTNLESAIFALKHGARDYLIKPVNPDEFCHSVALCMQQRRLLDENQELKNMLSLFQTSQAIAGCIELEHAYHLIVEAVIREMGLHRAVGLFTENGHKFELKEYKGITQDQAFTLQNMIQGDISEWTPRNQLITKITCQGTVGMEVLFGMGISEAYLVFIRAKAGVHGVVAVFNNNGEPLPDIQSSQKNILFLLEQSVRTFENAESLSNARDMLFIDDLSGLFNYRYLDVALDRELKRAERYSSHLAILFLDIDSFKQVNDTHGHLVGSAVIREMGILLKKSCRDVDVVIRYGGDEYTIVLVETDCKIAAMVAERIRSQVASHLFMQKEGLSIKLTCSIGYACCPDDTMSKVELLGMADKAMYAGKSSGKNCVIKFTASS